jgi:hypothetical protein
MRDKATQAEPAPRVADRAELRKADKVNHPGDRLAEFHAVDDIDAARH